LTALEGGAIVMASSGKANGKLAIWAPVLAATMLVPAVVPQRDRVLAVISSELDVDRSPYPHPALIYLNAGHGVGTFPYLPIGSAALQALGGTRAGDVAAQRASWALVLGQLARLSG
jgi:hypothetical protein